MAQVRFIMVGGFLGAGKTTTLGQLARHYIGIGKRIGIITNDQAQDLADTNLLRSQGFAVAEVPGACFCCKFDELVDRVTDLTNAGTPPDIILAEPVGSCTDLVATVVQPLKDIYREAFIVAPYAVLFKPSHGLRILRNESAGFSPKAAYIFRKQLEEADLIVMNRIDELSASDRSELRTLLERDYPGTPIVEYSAKTGAGLESLLAHLEADGAYGRKILDIDYDIYAEGEAELGWLNLAADVSGPAFDLDALLVMLLERLRDTLGERGAEVAHLKVIGMEDGRFAGANLIGGGTTTQLSVSAGREPVTHAEVIVNARVAMDPTLLQADVETALAASGQKITLGRVQALRPGRPTPTHRYAVPS